MEINTHGQLGAVSYIVCCESAISWLVRVPVVLSKVLKIGRQVLLIINEKYKMTIHKKIIDENQTNYYFTKTKKKCLMVIYDKTEDYGRHSTSGTDLQIQIHHNNSWIKDRIIEIELSEVPQIIIEVLTYLK